MSVNAQLSSTTSKGTRRKLFFCTHERCPEGLNFQPGCWSKQCFSKAKFYGKKHQCRTAGNASTCSYVFLSEAQQDGCKFVTKGTPEGIKASQETSYTGADLVWIPAETTLVPHVPVPKQSSKHKLELEKEGHSSEAAFKRQVWFSSKLTAPPIPRGSVASITWLFLSITGCKWHHKRPVCSSLRHAECF